MINQPLDEVLRKLLTRVPSRSGTTYLLRDHAIEITTFQAVREQVWGKDYPGPFLPLVDADINSKPLADAVNDLARTTGCTAFIDPRAAGKAKTPVTARLRNTPLDTALRQLSDQAKLTAVAVDNTFIITTRARAKTAAGQERKLFGVERQGTILLPPLTFPPSQLPKVSLVLNQMPLTNAIEELTERLEFSIILDPRAREQAKTPLTARLCAVPVDEAVAVLADMAGMKSVHTGHLIYVTTPANAERFAAARTQATKSR